MLMDVEMLMDALMEIEMFMDAMMDQNIRIIILLT